MRFTRYDQVSTTEFTNEVCLLLSEWHLNECPEGCQAFEDIALLVFEKDVRGLSLYELPAPSTESVSTYRHLRQILAFFEKRRDTDLGIDTQAVAWEKFKECEKKCLETNETFRKYSRGGFYFHPRVESVMFIAQRKISAILGDLPPLEELRLRFGPGATTQVKKKDASARRKFAQAFSVAEDAIRFLPELLAEMPLWSQLNETGSISHTVLIQEGRVDFVRKSCKTDRTIVVEPSLTGMVQLAIGDVISERLARQGVDLRDQTVNQRLAHEGSLTGELATLDLSSASDLVSSGLVESLLPFDWWDFLRAFRTGNVLTPEGKMKLEKFSSMGNGFTFALESLIFYSLAKACEEVTGRGRVSVYGDDIIVPTTAVPLLLEVLVACGFAVNAKKSFWKGPFRESCGKDYYSGIDVRPVYVKDVFTAADIFRLHNWYARMFAVDPSSLLSSYIDDSLALWGPDGFGDGHLICEDPVLVPHNRERGWGGCTFETYTLKGRKGLYRLGADYVYPSYSIYLKDAWEPDDESRNGFRLDSHGQSPKGIRPDSAPSRYAKDKWGRTCLEDPLPGVLGYKRVKIYTLQR